MQKTIAILVNGKYDDTVSDIKNNSVISVKTWCAKEDLKVKPRKITTVPFTRKRNLTVLDRICLGKCSIENICVG